MALFTDGPASSMEDLTAQDSQLLRRGRRRGNRRGQKLALAQDELALELDALVDQVELRGPVVMACAPAESRQRGGNAGAENCGTPFAGLEMVYSDAYNSQLNDRYAGKRDQFHARAKWAYETLVSAGIGVASVPVPRAAMPTGHGGARHFRCRTKHLLRKRWPGSTPRAKREPAPYRRPSRLRGARCWSSLKAIRRERRRDGKSTWAPIPMRWRCKTDRPSPSGNRGCNRRPWRLGGHRDRGNVPVI